MAAPVTAAPARPLPSTVARTFAALAVIGIALIVAVIAFAAWSPRIADDASVAPVQYGAGYPAHDGLAGPSRISVFDQHAAYRAGYPLHGGLAGPSRVASVEQSGFGAGYPAHGGLAGPSGVTATEQSGFGAGYPLHGGLAGPSQLDD